MPCRRAARAALVSGVVLLGLVVRLLGIRMGLPFHHHWDEGWIADSAAEMLRQGSDVPRSYQYGAPLIRLTEFAFLAARGRLAPVELTPDDAQVALYVMARVITAVIASSGTVAVYWAGWCSEPSRPRAFRVGLASALMYATAWELVLHSRYGVTDACLVGLTAWTLAFAAAYARTRRLAWALASVVAAGLTTAFKVPGVVTAIVPIAALLAVRPRSSRRGALLSRLLLLAAVPIVVGVFVFFNSHVIDRAGDASRDIVGRMKQTHDGGASAIYLRQPGLPHLASALWAIGLHFMHRTPAVSLAFTAVALGGLAASVRAKRTIVAIALLHAVIVVLSVALPNRVFWIRNYIVVTPCLCLGFGHGLVALIEKARGRAIATAAIGLVVAAGLVVAPLGYAIAGEEAQEDPRTRAIDWIQRHTAADGAAQVAVTPGVFAKDTPGTYPALRDLEARPNVRIAGSDIDGCPAPDGPDYIVDASYRDPKNADPGDPYAPQWLFKECPGYDAVAAFDSNPYEYDDDTQPTWIGRVSLVVLRRVGL